MSHTESHFWSICNVPHLHGWLRHNTLPGIQCKCYQGIFMSNKAKRFQMPVSSLVAHPVHISWATKLSRGCSSCLLEEQWLTNSYSLKHSSTTFQQCLRKICGTWWTFSVLSFRSPTVSIEDTLPVKMFLASSVYLLSSHFVPKLSRLASSTRLTVSIYLKELQQDCITKYGVWRNYDLKIVYSYLTCLFCWHYQQSSETWLGFLNSPLQSLF